MAANFGYDEEYVDEKLDMERLFAHLEYLHKCPPPGMLIKAYDQCLQSHVIKAC